MKILTDSPESPHGFIVVMTTLILFTLLLSVAVNKCSHHLDQYHERQMANCQEDGHEERPQGHSIMPD